jgi:tetratricopeptide (TPR) repeat protein
LTASRRAEAIALAEKVWAARVKAHGDDHPKSIAAMSQLAFIFQGSYRMKEALALYQRARDQIVPKLGDYHPLTIVILRDLGHMLRVYERTGEAVSLLEVVRERELMIHGGQHPSTLATLFHLAAAYKGAGDLDKALALLQQAADGAEKLNFEHSYSDMILKSLAIVHENMKQLGLAELARRKSLRVIERRHGPDSGQYAAELIRIGSLLLQQKKQADAEPGLRQALGILERHPDAGEQLYAQSLLGWALADQQRYADAEPLLRESYLGMKNFATQHKGQGSLPRGRQVDAVKRLVQVYEAWGKPEEAVRWRKELDSEMKDLEQMMKPKDK